MRTPGITTLSAPIVTSSPIATPSWMRTCERMSHDRPMTAPSIRAEAPMCVEASMTDRAVRARSRSVTLALRTVCAPTSASAPMRE